MMTEELEHPLKSLRLRRVLEVYDEQLKAVDKRGRLLLGVRHRLMRAQWHTRQEHPSARSCAQASQERQMNAIVPGPGTGGDPGSAPMTGWHYDGVLDF
jgi:hypothetical protein